MIQRLEHLNRSWELHYSARLARACAFSPRLVDLERAGRSRPFQFRSRAGGAVTDLNTLMSRASRGAHLYCCGPTACFAHSRRGAGDRRSRGRIHTGISRRPRRGPVYILPRARSSGRSLECRRPKPFSTLLDSNVDAPFSLQGTCGTCETKVIEGIPDHRDAFLTPGERASNRTMMICCSGSKSSKLVLDI